MEFPFAGSRMLQGLLVQEGFKVGRLHVVALMKRMGIEARYRKPKTSKPATGHKISPPSCAEIAYHKARSGLPLANVQLRRRAMDGPWRSGSVLNR